MRTLHASCYQWCAKMWLTEQEYVVRELDDSCYIQFNDGAKY